MDSRKELVALRARWEAQGALQAADRAFKRMDPVAAYQGRPPPFPLVSPFGEHEGRRDFRCLPLGEIPAYRTFERVDLTGATDARRGQLGQATWVDCLFDRVAMETNCGKSFVRCRFRRAKLSHSSLAGEFIACDFTGADLSHTRAAEVRFTDCRFDAANLVDASWLRTHFLNCSFTDAKIGNAAWAHVRFVGGRPNDEQLASAMAPHAVFVDRLDEE